MLLQANLSAALPVNDYFFHKAHFSVFFLFSVIRNPGYLGHNFHTGATQVYQAGNDDRKAAASFTIYYCNLKKTVTNRLSVTEWNVLFFVNVTWDNSFLTTVIASCS